MASARMYIAIRQALLSMLGALVLALTGCAQFAAKPSPEVDTAKMVFSPIIPSLDDVLTDGTASQILLHNCLGYRLGYWNTRGMDAACDFVADPATP